MELYFGPLDKSSCRYFLFIAMFFFFMMVIAIISDVIWVVKNYKSLNSKSFSGAILMLFNLFIAYFVNRLLYSMCSKSLA